MILTDLVRWIVTGLDLFPGNNRSRHDQRLYKWNISIKLSRYHLWLEKAKTENHFVYVIFGYEWNAVADDGNERYGETFE